MDGGWLATRTFILSPAVTMLAIGTTPGRGCFLKKGLQEGVGGTLFGTPLDGISGL